MLVICAVAGLFLSRHVFDGREPPPMRPGFVAPLIGVMPPGDRRGVRAPRGPGGGHPLAQTPPRQ
ncbi:hypothetical protein [Mangrovicoccus ximenensis]|uniref:hypothetical protein n=1 Tax=Mangrovicoccus ximenensis TaxID=1911570 RepID=UPI000D3922AD|nr:hypothetical protein [Mangrovicoccus ximenensis]